MSSSFYLDSSYPLDQHILAAKVRLARLERQHQARSPEQDPAMTEAIVELSIALEELHVANEDLQQKNDYLLLLRHDLAQERQRYKTLFDCGPDPYVVTDAVGTVQAVNHRAALLLDQRPDFLVNKPITLMIAKADRPLVHQKLTQIQAYVPGEQPPKSPPPSVLQDWPMPSPIMFWQDQSLHLQFRGQSAAISVTLSLSGERDDQGNLLRLLWVFRDVRQRRQGEIALQALAQEFQTLYDQAPCGYHSLDAEGRLTRINETELRWLGYDPDQLLGTPWRDLLTPISQQRFDHASSQLQQQGHIKDLELELRGCAGQIVPVSLSVTALQDAEGQLRMSRAVVIDIGDHRQQTQTIAQQAALLDITADGIWVQDLDNCISFWNQGAETLYGWTAAEALGQNATSFLHPDPKHLDQIWPHLVNDGTWTGELEQVTRANETLWVVSRWSMITDDSGQQRSILVANTNITTQKQLEQQFYRAQRLESLGTLAGGIAHDLNNVFTPILAIAQLLSLKFPQLDDETQKLLQVLQNGTQRGAKLVDQILTSTRGSQSQPTQLNISSLLTDTVILAQQTLPKSIVVNSNWPADPLWPVFADETQLHQVLMNLIVNGRDAMPRGGTLTLTADNYVLDSAEAQLQLNAQAGNYLRITVTDTGIGMTPAAQEQIFEPFFTTKTVDKGSGLGLATVQGIIKQHGGFVKVSSQVGTGSTFEVYLPVSDSALLAVEQPAETLVRGNGALILIVEDDGLMQQTIPILLNTYGYQTLLAQDGLEALTLFKTHHASLAGILMDIRMPNLDGLAAIQEIQSINPQVPIVAVSGLPSHQAAALSAGARAFLPKPYTTVQLLQTFTQILSQS